MAKKIIDDSVKRVRNYTETFSTRSGAAVMDDLMKQYYHTPSYVPGDPYGTAYREGQRSVILAIMSALQHSAHPQAFELPDDDYNPSEDL